MNKKMFKQMVGLVLGWFFILLGIIGMLLPFLHGILFFLAGMLILSKTSPWAKNLLVKMENRFPVITKQLDKLRKHPKLKRILP
ncbi:PGPGW domain-containing protein [Melghirimyces algeriensis]|uniref:Transmembrane protein (PGPGW) n=1 Tax=Melghirimyces algeriensis TaxID=910412 RepID=A0A521BSF4_9BACL|nr:PGPGW domain-containing protein [Melghirimyces algeriensis]SMO49671.1 Putative transmembrane protein (PGPGW) [Melghirimyces algeriensis]